MTSAADAPTAEALLELARTVAREAAEHIQRLRAEGVDVAGTKSSEVDVVTLADQASEKLIREQILGARPDDGFVGEEGDDVTGSSGVRWVVDPIDGTVNYLYGVPAYAVSVAAQVSGEVVAGVVLNPAVGEEFAATRGGGATRNGLPIGVRSFVSLEQSLFATGFSYEQAVRARQAGAIARVLPRVRDIRRLGSCALDLCGVADGRFDAYAEEGVNLWDHAAGALVATEAGARVEVTTAPSGRAFILCAPRASFDSFHDLARDAGML
ncbi:MAG TPA: inositol monophosphatase family protein [Marmoricola sp.]|nr:inositol monophosphatase family protein [Marmoricola sp.]